MELRAKHPDISGEGSVRLKDVVAVYEKFCLDEGGEPILIGHSLGGLIVQILLSRGIGSAGIAIDSAPPKGVLTANLSFVRSNWPILTPFSPRTTPVLLTKDQFRYAFAQRLNGTSLLQAYEAVVPQSRFVGLDTLTNDARINFTKKKAPLLLIAGERDNIVPASLNKSNFQRYAHNSSRTDFKLFAGRTHYLINDEGWNEIAAYSLNWLNEVSRPKTS